MLQTAYTHTPSVQITVSDEPTVCKVDYPIYLSCCCFFTYGDMFQYVGKVYIIPHA